MHDGSMFSFGYTEISTVLVPCTACWCAGWEWKWRTGINKSWNSHRNCSFCTLFFSNKIYWGKKKQWNRAMPLNQFCQPVKHFLFQLFSTTSPFKLILSHTMKHCRGVLVFLFMLLNLCLSGVFYLFVCFFGLVCEDTATYVCLRLCI